MHPSAFSQEMFKIPTLMWVENVSETELLIRDHRRISQGPMS